MIAAYAVVVLVAVLLVLRAFGPRSWSPVRIREKAVAWAPVAMAALEDRRRAEFAIRVCPCLASGTALMNAVCAALDGIAVAFREAGLVEDWVRGSPCSAGTVRTLAARLHGEWQECCMSGRGPTAELPPRPPLCLDPVGRFFLRHHSDGQGAHLRLTFHVGRLWITARIIILAEDEIGTDRDPML